MKENCTKDRKKKKGLCKSVDVYFRSYSVTLSLFLHVCFLWFLPFHAGTALIDERLRPGPIPLAPPFGAVARFSGEESTYHDEIYEQQEGNIIQSVVYSNKTSKYVLHGYKGVSALDTTINQG